MLNLTYSILTSFGHAPDACSCMPPPHTHTHCDLCTNSLNQDGLDGLESSSIGMGFSTTHSLSVPYVSAAATNMPRVSPYVSSSNSTETFSDLVRRLLTSQIGCPRTTRRCRGGRTSARASGRPRGREAAGDFWGHVKFRC